MRTQQNAVMPCILIMSAWQLLGTLGVRHRVSEGMAHEISVAKKRKQTIRWFNESCEEVSGNERI